MITHKDPVLLGLSFGGMMAIEVAEKVKTEKIVLLSSAKERSEIPPLLRLAGTLRLDRLLPAKLLKLPGFISYRYFGTQTPEEKQMLRTILRETDPVYLKWAVARVLRWQRKDFPENIFHIHGTADRVFPIGNVSCDRTVEGGRHFMVMSRAAEVSALIDEALSKTISREA
jgi:pimeloyl-ACP methyl ester carboxylesterase